MKKKLLTLLLIISMLVTVLPANKAFAQEAQTNQWAFYDLAVGDTYNIYPMSWYNKNMQAPITHGQLRILLAGLRAKILATGCVLDYNEQKHSLKNKMTVKEYLEFLYALLSDYEFNGDIGITNNGKALDYMAAYGIFTGKEGELSLKDVCTVDQACVIATRLITHVYDALDAASKGFLWEIKSGENTVYLLGSVHMANYEIYPFSNKMLEAFAKADVLGVEVDLLNPAQDVNSLLLKYGIYMDGTTLKDHVSEETYEKTVQVAANFGYTEELLSMLKPWTIFSIFSALTNTTTGTTEETALAASLGIDMKFLTDAYMFGKPVIEMEGYDLQLQVLNSFSDELAEFLLISTMDALSALLAGEETTGGNDTLNIILDYWHRGDVEGFMRDIAPIMVAAETPDMEEEDKELLPLMEEYYGKIFQERDKGMAEKIDAFLKAEGSTTYFIVVGSGHYISNYSVLDILKDMGYEINQIK